MMYGYPPITLMVMAAGCPFLALSTVVRLSVRLDRYPVTNRSIANRPCIWRA